MIKITYNKTEALTGFTTPILRFLPREVAMLMFTYLVYIRPVEVVFTRSLYGEQAAIDCATFLLFSKGQRMDAEAVRQAFKLTMTEFRLPLSVSQYRQVIIGLLNHQPVSPDLKEYLPVAEQAGHSEETEEFHYGRSVEEIMDTPDVKAKKFRLVSMLVHSLYGFE